MLLILTTSCSSNDERLVELSEQATARQQAQNEVIARQSKTTAELSHGFIEAETQARQELLELQQQLVEADAESREDLQRIHQQVVQRDAAGWLELNELLKQTHASIAARSKTIDQQRDALEQERRQIASMRQRAPVVAEAVKFAGGLLVCLVPLLVVVYLIRRLGSTEAGDAAMIEVLVNELTASHPKLLSPVQKPPALTNTEQGAAQ